MGVWSPDNLCIIGDKVGQSLLELMIFFEMKRVIAVKLIFPKQPPPLHSTEASWHKR